VDFDEGMQDVLVQLERPCAQDFNLDSHIFPPLFIFVSLLILQGLHLVQSDSGRLSLQIRDPELFVRTGAEPRHEPVLEGEDSFERETLHVEQLAFLNAGQTQVVHLVGVLDVVPVLHAFSRLATFVLN